MNNQDNKATIERNKPMAVFPESDNQGTAEDNDFKGAIINMFKDFNKDMNEKLNETQLNKITKTIKNTKVGFNRDSLKKI